MFTKNDNSNKNYKFCLKLNFSILLRTTIKEELFRLKMFSLQHESVFSHAFAVTLLLQVKIKREREKGDESPRGSNK